MDSKELFDLLEMHSIPTERWGTNGFKSLRDLHAEIQAKEARLVKQEGKLIRLISTVAIDVFHTSAGVTWKLKEDKQIMRGTEIRRRNYPSSVSEKMKLGENARIAAYRGLREELGIEEQIPLISMPTEIRKPVQSLSYPGLLTRNILIWFRTFMPDGLYRPEGYIERQETKETCFVWEKVLS